MIKKGTYRVDNGTDFDEIHFKTSADQVIFDDGTNLATFKNNSKNCIIDTLRPVNSEFKDILIITNKSQDGKVNLLISATLTNAIQGKSYVIVTLPEHLKPKFYTITDISCLDTGGNFIRVCGLTLDQNGVLVISRPVEGFYSTTNKFATTFEYVTK